MPALLDHIDPNGLEEFSVVFTDRSLNHMSKEFQQVMCDLPVNLVLTQVFWLLEMDGFLIDGAKYLSRQQTLDQPQ
jgi:hypothetical protein